MTVFKGYLKIAKQNIWIFLLYMAIFISVTFMIQGSVPNSSGDSYSAKSLKLGIVDEDGGSLATALETYLGTYHELIPLENDLDVLQENLFYRNVEYIVRIPADFAKTCLVNGGNLSVTKIPQSYTSFYVDGQINSFLNSARSYHAAGFTEDEIAGAIQQPELANVTLLDKDGSSTQVPDYIYYFRYIPYIFIAVLCFALGSILSAFRRGDLPKRMYASAITPRRQSLEGFLAVGLLGCGLWVFCILLGFVLYGTELLLSSNLVYYLINTFAMLLVGLSLSYLIGSVVKNKDALSGIVNTLSLGMSFLCGVFVPLSMMSSNVKTVAQFLPVYWYEKANDLLGDYSSISGSALTSVMQSIGIQLVFAVAFVCITMTIAKRKRQGGEFR